MAIGLTHGGSNVYSSSGPSNEILVGSKHGVAVLRRQSVGSDWHLAHQALDGLHVSSIIFEPESGTIFAGAFHDWVYASTDGGESWEQRSTGMSVNDVYSLACVNLDGQPRVYAGTQPAHLFYSDDLGRSWTELPGLRQVQTTDQWWFPAPPHIAHTKFITFDPHDPTTIYACIEQGALLKSTDNGVSWREINSVGFMSDQNRSIEHFYDVHKALIDPRDPQRIYCTGGAGLYVTPDGGGHWERWMSPDWAPDVYPDGFVMRPRDPDVMFVSAAEHNPSRWCDAGRPGWAGGRIFRSTDGGREWEPLGNGLPARMRDEFGALCIEDWGAGCAVFAATTGGQVFASDDGGDHWSLIAEGIGPVSKKGHEQLVAVA